MKLYKWIGNEVEAKIMIEKVKEDEILTLQNEDETLVLQEGDKATIQFNESYDILSASGQLHQECFAVLNNVPVSEEGREIFEHRFKNRAGLIEEEPGFIAIRVLRPLESDTYVILTLWENEASFTGWQQSQAYSKAHEKRGTAQGIDKRPNIFPRPSFVTTYQ